MFLQKLTIAQCILLSDLHSGLCIGMVPDASSTLDSSDMYAKVKALNLSLSSPS